ncbi:MAG: hypothetical protein WBX11_08315 [Thiobacillaceae bacterium]
MGEEKDTALSSPCRASLARLVGCGGLAILLDPLRGWLLKHGLSHNSSFGARRLRGEVYHIWLGANVQYFALHALVFEQLR